MSTTDVLVLNAVPGCCPHHKDLYYVEFDQTIHFPSFSSIWQHMLPPKERVRISYILGNVAKGWCTFCHDPANVSVGKG